MAYKYEKTRSYAGQSAIRWSRQSSREQSECSNGDQLHLMDAFAINECIHIVDDLILDDTSGSSSKIRQHVLDLIERKRRYNDFELLLVQDYSRLTRSGPKEAFHLIQMLADVGVEVVPVNDRLPEGDMGEAMQFFQHLSAKQYSKSVAYNQTRGAMSSLLSGKTPIARRQPYGIDRMVCDAQDNPKFILHAVGDGTQHQLEIGSRRIMQTFGRSEVTGVAAHYIKQQEERVKLVPGDPHQIAVINEIYRLYLVEGLGSTSIARRLNDRGEPSPGGKSWYSSAVLSLLNNTLYVGLSVGHRSTVAKYYMRGQNGPEEIIRRPEETAGRAGNPVARPRPLEDWEIDRVSSLRGILPPDIRRIARRRQVKRLREEAAGKPRSKPKTPRSKDPRFLLTGRLKSRDGGWPMTGRVGGKNSSIAYYAVSRAANCPKTGVSSKLVRAEPINELVVNAIRQVMGSLPDLRERVRRQAHERFIAESAQKDGQGEDDVKKERDRLVAQLNLLTETLDNIEIDTARRRSQDLVNRIKVLDRRIQASQSTCQTITAKQIDANIDSAFSKLSEAPDIVAELGLPAMQKLLDILLREIVIDPDTGHWEMTLQLPEWAVEVPERVCLTKQSTSTSPRQATPLVTTGSGFHLLKSTFSPTPTGWIGVHAA